MEAYRFGARKGLIARLNLAQDKPSYNIGKARRKDPIENSYFYSKALSDMTEVPATR